MNFSLESLIFVGEKTLKCNETRTHKQIDRQKQNICNKEFIYKWKGKTFYLEEAKLTESKNMRMMIREEMCIVYEKVGIFIVKLKPFYFGNNWYGQTFYHQVSGIY